MRLVVIVKIAMLLCILIGIAMPVSTDSYVDRIWGEQQDHLEDADPSTSHEIIIAVKQTGTEQLESLLRQVSYPDNALYKKYLTRQQIAEMTGHDTSSRIVTEFFIRNGLQVTHRSKYGEYITVRGSIGAMNQIFSTRFCKVRVKSSNRDRSVERVVHRVRSYSVPPQIADHIDTIFQMDELPPPYDHSAPIRESDDESIRPASSSGGKGYVDPDVLTHTYAITNSGSGEWNFTLGSQCIYATANQNYSPNDLKSFLESYELPSVAVGAVIGGHNISTVCESKPDLCTEANLDVQYMLAISPHVPSFYWYDNSTEYFVLNWIKEVSSMDSPPLVISISYGVLEAYVSRGYARAFDTEAVKLGLQGVTIVVSSGDDGAAGYLARSDASYCGYYPLWPASSQYVVAVGGTQGLEAGKDDESACMSGSGGVITSGGGFSNLNMQPDYQTEAVDQYLNSFSKKTAPYQGSADGYYYDSYRVAGRAYPDVAVAAAKYRVLIGNEWQLVSGTSASAPVMAGLIATINSMLLGLGRPSVGWINPIIYANGSHFLRDITSGNNKCTALGSSGSPVCCKHVYLVIWVVFDWVGFYALRGWDPVTGMGTPYFPALVDYFIYGNSTELNANSAFAAVSMKPLVSLVVALLCVIWLAVL